MANLTNSAKLIEEMDKKAYKTELPTVNNATVSFTVNGNTGSTTMTTNQAANSTVNLSVTKSTVGLGNVDNTSDTNKPISNATQTALNAKANANDVYSKAEVDAKLSSVYKYKGSVTSYSNLPSTGQTIGDVYNVEDTGDNYAWDGNGWDKLGGTIDLSNYVDKTTSQTISGTKTFSISPVVPAKSTDANSTGTTVIATEAQVAKKQNALSTAQLNAVNSGITSNKVNTYDGYATTIAGKQDALTQQTAYTSKGTSTKVATITTNSLGQVTAITETNISYPVSSVNGQTGDVTIDTISKVPTTQPSNPELGSIYYDTSTGAIMVYDGTEWKKAGGGGGGDVKLPAIADLTAVKGNAKATLTWTDPDNVIIDGYTFATWASTKLVRKAGSAPTSISDGTLVTKSTVKNQYSSTGFVDTGLVNGTTYYYAAFAISEAGNETISNIASAKPVAYQTYTVSWTESSTPASWTNTYSNDAAGMSEQSGDFDDFFGYDAVALNDDGSIADNGNAILTQSQGVFSSSLSTFASLYSGKNIMIRFPKRGIKMTKSGSVVTLSITDEPDKSGYQYYAFNDHGTAQDYLCLGAFKGSISDNKLKSVSGATPGNQSLNSAVAAANAYGGTHYHEESWFARQYINALYKMKWANPNSQTAVGRGFVDGNSAAHVTGGSWSDSGSNAATRGETTGKKQMRLFGLEDWWGNVWEWMDGAYYSSGTNLQTSSTGAFLTDSRITSFDKNTTVASGWMSSIAGTNDGMFAGNATSGSSSTYYCDYFNAYSGYSLFAGGNRSRGGNAGAFDVHYSSAGTSATHLGSRLMFL